MTDVFDQIEDDLRQQKLQQFWKENGAWIIGGAIGAVLLTGVLTLYRHWEHGRDIRSTTEMMRIAATYDMPQLETFAEKTDKKHAVMARLLAASRYAEKKEYDKAIALYAAAANTRGADPVWRDFARIHSLSLRLDKDPSDALKKELSPLTKDSNPWRFMALEMEGLLAARDGHMKEAADIMTKIAANPLAPEDQRQRAVSLRALYAADTRNEPKS